MIGIILAGGESRRFGSQKAFHKLDGQPFYRRIARVMEASEQFSRIVISSNTTIADHFEGYPVIIDHDCYINHGPLAGIYAVMETCPADAYMVISVDTPYITTAAINVLAGEYKGNLTVYKDNIQIHGTIGIYPNDLKPTIHRLLDEKRLAIRNLFTEDTKYVNVTQVPGNWYANINTPGDLAAKKAGELDDRTNNR
ncbi:molybdenum cofactor guanylyltransferase [Macrococcus lamae]|uniref:molybdenum cofactor guanylyltransferase n=1 Tax=Macrococcus lamae TaxID=198484 RepID=UPI0014089CC0|nr:molybdenum cofactor guanylyltransferase [Macrococcus lamae]